MLGIITSILQICFLGVILYVALFIIMKILRWIFEILFDMIK